MPSVRAILAVIGGGLGATVGAAVGATLGATVAATQPTPAQASGATLRGTIAIAGETSPDKSALSRTVVYLGSDPVLDAAALPAKPAVVEQIDKSFRPDFVVVPRGTIIEFPNWDHIAHNVFSRSAAAPAFDLDRYPYGQSKSRKFDKLGIVQVFCNIHPQMRAMIFVTPNRCFTRADETGHFTLAGLPSGHYELVAWNERCDESRQPVEVTAGAAAPDLTITLKPSAKRAIANGGVDRPEPYGAGRGLPVKREQLGLPVVHDVHPAPTTAPAPESP